MILKRPMLRGLFHDSFVGISSSYLGDEPVLVFDALNLFVIDDDTFVLELHSDSPPAVFTFALVKDFFDEQIIFMVTIRLIGATEPLIISTL